MGLWKTYVKSELPSLAKTLKQGSANVYKATVLLSLSPISHHNLCHTKHHTNPSIVIMVTKSGGLETIFFADAVLFDMVSFLIEVFLIHL